MYLLCAGTALSTEDMCGAGWPQALLSGSFPLCGQTHSQQEQRDQVRVMLGRPEVWATGERGQKDLPWGGGMRDPRGWPCWLGLGTGSGTGTAKWYPGWRSSPRVARCLQGGPSPRVPAPSPHQLVSCNTVLRVYGRERLGGGRCQVQGPSFS